MFTISAHVGFATAALESVATTIGAGMLVSGFVMATADLARGRTPREIEENSLRDACIGGGFATWLIVFDLAMRYFV